MRAGRWGITVLDDVSAGHASLGAGHKEYSPHTPGNVLLYNNCYIIPTTAAALGPLQVLSYIYMYIYVCGEGGGVQENTEGEILLIHRNSHCRLKLYSSLHSLKSELKTHLFSFPY